MYCIHVILYNLHSLCFYTPENWPLQSGGLCLGLHKIRGIRTLKAESSSSKVFLKTWWQNLHHLQSLGRMLGKNMITTGTMSHSIHASYIYIYILIYHKNQPRMGLVLGGGGYWLTEFWRKGSTGFKSSRNANRFFPNFLVGVGRFFCSAWWLAIRAATVLRVISSEPLRRFFTVLWEFHVPLPRVNFGAVKIKPMLTRR